MDGMPSNRSEALKTDAPRYYTGVPCKHGHLTWRRTESGACATCLQYANRKSSPKLAGNQHFRSLLPGEVAPTSRAEAVSRGIDTFTTGKVCRNGHLDERHTLAGSCKSCVGSRSMHERKLPPAGTWVAHFYMPIPVEGAEILETRRMSARLPVFALGLLEDVRAGGLLSADEVRNAVRICYALRAAQLSADSVLSNMPVLSALSSTLKTE